MAGLSQDAAIQLLVDSGIGPQTADALIAETWNWDGLTDAAQRERVAWYIEDQRKVRHERGIADGTETNRA